MTTQPSMDQKVSAELKSIFGREFLTDLVRDGAKAVIVTLIVWIASLLASSSHERLWWLGVVVAVLSIVVGVVLLVRDNRRSDGLGTHATNATLGFIAVFTMAVIAVLLTWIFKMLF